MTGRHRSPGVRRVTVAALVALALAPAFAVWALEVPFLSGRVVDLAGLIDAEAEVRMTERLAALEKATGHQVAVLTVLGLEGDPVEDFSLRVVETWQLGRKDIDDGVLLLVARDDRKMRIEVGYGLEPTLTDALSRRILDNVMRPKLRAGDLSGGIEAGTDAIAGVLSGSDLPPPDATAAGGRERDLGVYAFFAFVLLMIGGSALFTPGTMGWVQYAMLIPFWAAMPILVFGKGIGLPVLASWVIGAPIARLLIHHTAAGRAWRNQRFARAARRRRYGNTWSSSGGWGSGGGFGGGGFSGGGGSFGGGGSSSGW